LIILIPSIPCSCLCSSVFVATWNVGGKSPHSDLNLDQILHTDQSDIYVLGYALFLPA